MLVDKASKRAGLTLVEVVVSVVIFTFAALALARFLVVIQYKAENSLYDATALSVVTNVFEQLKRSDFGQLTAFRDAGSFSVTKFATDDVTMNLGQPNEWVVDVNIDDQGNTLKSMSVFLTPSITLVGDSCVVEIEYTYERPRGGDRTLSFRCLRVQTGN